MDSIDEDNIIVYEGALPQHFRDMGYVGLGGVRFDGEYNDIFKFLEEGKHPDILYNWNKQFINNLDNPENARTLNRWKTQMLQRAKSKNIVQLIEDSLLVAHSSLELQHYSIQDKDVHQTLCLSEISHFNEGFNLHDVLLEIDENDKDTTQKYSCLTFGSGLTLNLTSTGILYAHPDFFNR